MSRVASSKPTRSIPGNGAFSGEQDSTWTVVAVGLALPTLGKLAVRLTVRYLSDSSDAALKVMIANDLLPQSNKLVPRCWLRLNIERSRSLDSPESIKSKRGSVSWQDWGPGTACVLGVGSFRVAVGPADAKFCGVVGAERNCEVFGRVRHHLAAVGTSGLMAAAVEPRRQFLAVYSDDEDRGFTIGAVIKQ